MKHTYLTRLLFCSIHLVLLSFLFVFLLAICCLISEAPLFPPEVPWGASLVHMLGTLTGLVIGIFAVVDMIADCNIVFKNIIVFQTFTKGFPGFSTIMFLFLSIAPLYCVFIAKGLITNSEKGRSLRHFLWVNKKRLLIYALSLLGILCFILVLPARSYCDTSTPFSGPSITSAAPSMEGIIALHSDIWAIMLFVAIFVLYILCSALSRFNNTSVTKSYKVQHNSTAEIIWTTLPALLLCVIAIPSFTLLGSLDDIVDSTGTINVIGQKWDWAYEYGDCGVDPESNLGCSGLIFDSYLLQEDLIDPCPTNEPVAFSPSEKATSSPP